MAKPDPKRCPHLKARVWAEEGLAKPAPPLPHTSAPGGNLCLFQNGEGKGRASKPSARVPWEPPPRGED